MKHKSEIRRHGGLPALFIDGEMIPPMAYQFMSSDKDITNNIPLPPFMPTDVQLKAMGSAGVKLYFIRMEMYDPEDIRQVFDKLAFSLRQLRRCVPGAWAMPWLIICPYEDFARKYPGDAQQFDDGSIGGYSGNLKGRIRSAEIPRHTHASLAWRHETAGALRELVRLIEAEEDLDDTVVGYFFFPLQHEACYFGDFDHARKLDGYSPAMKLAFRNYLAEKYAGRESLLRKAWHDESVTFASAEIPGRALREDGSAGLFWDGAKSQRVIDFAEIRSRVWRDTLEYFARAVKEESGGRAVVGSFWGYLIHNDVLWGGQSYFRQMMDSPFLDFWASPFTYVNKNPGMSVTVRFLTRSLQVHGKLFFAECDTTTTTSDEGQRRRQGMVIDDPALDAEVLKREFAYTLTEGMNGWWIDWPSGTAQYDEEKLLPLMRRMQEIGRESAEKPMGSVARAAALVEQDSLFCVPNTHSRLTSCAIEWPRIEEVPYLGTPVDHLELRDVLRGGPEYDLYLFLNAYRADARTRRDAESLRRKGRTLVFMYAQGYLSPDDPTASAQNVSAFTGIRMREAPGPLRGRIVLNENAALLGLTPGDEVGEFDRPVCGGMGFYTNGGKPTPPPNQPLDPVLIPDDPDMTVLGVYRENGLPALVTKEKDGCLLVYFGALAPTARVLRALCRRQGIHLYNEQDAFVFANKSYVGLHAPADGRFTLALPEKRALREVFSGERLPPSERIVLTLRKGETRLYEQLVTAQP